VGIFVLAGTVASLCPPPPPAWRAAHMPSDAADNTPCGRTPTLNFAVAGLVLAPLRCGSGGATRLAGRWRISTWCWLFAATGNGLSGGRLRWPHGLGPD